MRIKRKLSKIDLFIKKFQDPSTTFVSLSEFNENVNENENLIEIFHLLTEVKRKSSENIIVYQFLTHLLSYFTQTNRIHHSERWIQQFRSFSTIYFLLSSNSTANHLKFLISIWETSEFAAKWLFSSLDLKKTVLEIASTSTGRKCSIFDDKIHFFRFFLPKFRAQSTFFTRFSLIYKDSTENIEFILENLKNHVILSQKPIKFDCSTIETWNSW